MTLFDGRPIEHADRDAFKKIIDSDVCGQYDMYLFNRDLARFSDDHKNDFEDLAAYIYKSKFHLQPKIYFVDGAEMGGSEVLACNSSFLKTHDMPILEYIDLYPGMFERWQPRWYQDLLKQVTGDDAK